MRQNVFYVSTEGNDRWSGTGAKPNKAGTDGPFKTVERARDAVRIEINIGMSRDITVFIRGGSYYLDSTLVLDERDSGRNGYKVIYQSYPNENAVLNGGAAITGWEPYKDNIYKVKVDKNQSFNTLYENEKRSVKARFPKEGYLQARTGDCKPSLIKFCFGEFDIPHVDKTGDLQVHIWPGGSEGDWNWFTNTINVEGIHYDEQMVRLHEETDYEIGEGSRYYMQGALEFIDQPGDFHFDKQEGILYYYPYHTPIEEADIVIPKVERLLSVAGNSRDEVVQDIVFDGITFRNTNICEQITNARTEKLARFDGAVYLENVSNITITNCKIYNTGLHGIYLYGHAQENMICGNLIYDIGFTGLNIEGFREIDYYISKKNCITNNYIHDTGRLVGHGAGIQLYQSGENEISHNRIHHTPRYSISLKSSQLLGESVQDWQRTRDNVLYSGYNRDNGIEYNDLSDANYDSQDTGMIEMWGGGSGNLIHSNYLHDSNVNFSFGFGIYLDDRADYCEVSGNIIEGLQKEGNGSLMYSIYAKGINDVIVNNIVANNNVFRASLGTFEMMNPNKDIICERNIFFNSGDIYYFQNWGDDRFEMSDYNIYYNRDGKYGILDEIREPGAGSKEMGGIAGIRWKTIPLEHWKIMFENKHDQHSISTDPLFMNEENGDYRFRYDSPAHDLNIKKIDFANIGLKEDFRFTDINEKINRVYVHSDKTGCLASINLNMGERLTLYMTARTLTGYMADLREANICYSSSHPEIVSVNDEGKLTAIGQGVATITAKVLKGDIGGSTFIHVIVG